MTPMPRMTLALITALTAALTTPAAWAHAKLLKAEPDNGAALSAAPVAVRLKFNEPIELAMSRIQVMGAGDAPVATGALTLAEGDPRTLVLPLGSPLAAGSYRIQWSTMGRDGHPMKGELRFSVR